MSDEDTGYDEIIKKLDELIDLVRNTTKVENHTHHHYPTYPTYTYTNPWTFGGGQGTVGGWSTATPGTTTTFSTNDPGSNGMTTT